MNPAPPVVASIGTTHPWNAAGIGLDTMLLHDLGARPVSVIAGISAQSDRGVIATHPIPAPLITAQLSALDEAGIAAVRIGALLAPESVHAVSAYLSTRGLPVVCDPVIRTSDGGELATVATVDALVALFPHLTLLTPNLSEAEAFLGWPVDSLAAMERAARELAARGPQGVLVKGGHLAGAPCDVLFDGVRTHTFTGERVPDMRGTGCIIATAAALALARGATLHASVEFARDTVRRRLQAALPFGAMRVAF